MFLLSATAVHGMLSKGLLKC